MKGFKPTGKSIMAGHKFPEKFGFTSSSGKVQSVAGYTRRSPLKKATGGFVQEAGGENSYNTSKAKTIGDQGHSAEQRTQPITEFDAEHGGRGPLKPPFAKGGAVPRFGLGGAMAGMAGPSRMSMGPMKSTMQPQAIAMARAALAGQQRPNIGIPRPVMGRGQLMRAKGGTVPRFKKGGKD